MKNIQKIKVLIVRNTYAAVAVELLLALVIIPLAFGRADAAQLTSRIVTMSDSGVSGGTITSGVGSGTNVAYKFTFGQPNTTTAIGGIVVDFCSNTPLAGDTCTAPAGLVTNKGTTGIYNQSGLGTGAFAVYTTDAGTGNGNRLILTRATAANMTSSASFELGNGTNGITNPTTVGTFYVRIYTYTTAALAQGHTTSAATGYTDFGGVALSTANVITITARVQENIIFCMSAAAPSTNCSGTSVPAISIGQGTGTSKVLTSAAISTGVVYSQLSTNANTGAIVRIHGSNGSCGGLSSDGGTTCSIPPANSGAIAAPTGPMLAGTAAFGLTVATGSGGTGTVAPIAPYANSTPDYYGMDSLSATSVVTTYGSPVISTGTPVSNVNNTWTFGATASNVTPAGLYSTNLAAIATGTF